MIRRFDFGSPIETGAVVQPIPVCADAVPHFSVSCDGKPVDPEEFFHLGN